MSTSSPDHAQEQPQQRSVPQNRLLDVAVAILLGVVAFWHLSPGIESTPFHRDEARWIHRAYLLSEWRDPFSDRWQDDGYPVGENSWDERYRMRDQPPLAPYILGLGLLLQGHELDPNGFWVMDRDDAWNTANGNMPSPSVLQAARRIDVNVAALTVGLFYLLATVLSSRTGGVVAALYLAFNPLLLDTATRAWSDPLLALLLVLAALATYCLRQRPSWQCAITLGLLLGLGGAAKLSPLLLALAFGGLGLILLTTTRWQPKSFSGTPKLARQLISIPAVSFLAFYAVYPYLWPNPIGHTYRMFAFRLDSFDSQARGFPNAAVGSPLDAVHRIMDTQAWFSTGRYVADLLGLHIPLTTWPHIGYDDLDLLLALIGVTILARRVLRIGILSGPGLVSLFLTAQIGIILFTMGVDYPRYHLPITIAVSLLIGIAISAAINSARNTIPIPFRTTTSLPPHPNPISHTTRRTHQPH